MIPPASSPSPDVDPTRNRDRPEFRRRFILTLLISFLLLTACRLLVSETPPAEIESPPDQPGSAGEETAEAPGGLPDRTFNVNQQFWHSGFRVEVAEGRYYAEEEVLRDEVDYFVEIGAIFENLGGSNTFFDAPTALVWGGTSTPSLLNSELPQVPSGLSSEGGFRFAVDDAFDPVSAQLVIGAADENRAMVPLGPAAGELVSLAPMEFPLSGEISMELIDLTFESGELRADRPERYSQVADGKRALTVHFSATSRKGGSWNILDQDFALVLPSGSAVSVDGSQLGSLPGTDQGTVTGDLWVRFIVDEPTAGTYLLRFTPGDWFVGSDGLAEGTYEFRLE